LKAAFCPLFDRKREFPPAHLSVPTLSRFAKNGRKKSSKSFLDLLLHVPLWGGRIFSFYGGSV